MTSGTYSHDIGLERQQWRLGIKVSIKLGLASLSSLTLGLAILFLQSPTGSDAHAPLVVDSGGIIQSWGANSVNTNWANGWYWPNADTKQIAIVDDYGLPSEVKASDYYPTKDDVWNTYDNLHTWVIEGTPQQGGTAVYIDPDVGHVLCGNPIHACTHVHLWTWYWNGSSWVWEENNTLLHGPTYTGVLHLTSASLYSAPYPDSGATVISHEIGHVLGLADEDSGHSTIMVSPSPGVTTPSADDRRTEEVCIYNYPWTFPC